MKLEHVFIIRAPLGGGGVGGGARWPHGKLGVAFPPLEYQAGSPSQPELVFPPTK
jgi:hypothetical protein